VLQKRGGQAPRLNKINLIQSYGKPELFFAPISQIFPCVACNDHKKINDPQTWVPIFLRKSGITSWELFDADFNYLGHVLEWDGDEGLVIGHGFMAGNKAR
jgi:hypothetical protein